MKFIPFCFFLVLISSKIDAQNALVNDYIIKNNGDTLHGYLQLQAEKYLLRRVKFKTDQAGKFQVYSTSSIKAFKYGGGSLYRGLSFANNSEDSVFNDTCFAKALIIGRYELFSFVQEGDTYFVVKKDTATYLLYDAILSGNTLRKGNYLNQLFFLSIACESLRKGIERTRYSEKDISAFIRDLDICIAPGEAVSNESHKPPHLVDVVIFAGGLLLSNQQSQLSADAMIRLIYPLIDPKFSINIGLHYGKTFRERTDIGYLSLPYTTRSTLELFSVPFTLQYNLTDWFIQPYVYIGFSGAYRSETPPNPQGSNGFGDSFGVAIVGGIGIDAHITHRLTARVDWRYELFYHFPAVGLAYNF